MLFLLKGIEFPIIKQDEDITKQKRIEHITKLLKTDLIESFKSVSLDKSKEKELKETLQAAFSSSTSSITSPFSPKSSHNRFKSKSNNKDDIILRALLKTSDLEPQLLKLESVFDMNKAKKSPLSRHNSEVNETSSVSLNASTNILKVSDEDINHKSKNLKNGLSKHFHLNQTHFLIR